MIRLIILFAIFLAVYPMIGDGWAQFSTDFNVGAIMNTSFNIHGEPIVGSPYDAISTFKRCGLHHLYIGDWLVSKKEKI